MKFGGPDGELAASLRYLNQRYSAPYGEVRGLLTDIGTEELAHMEMISAILYQLTRNLTPEEIKESGFDTYFVDHTTGGVLIAEEFIKNTVKGASVHLPLTVFFL